jgi:hypothetical protein
VHISVAGLRHPDKMSLATAAPAQGSTQTPTLAEPSVSQPGASSQIEAKVQRDTAAATTGQTTPKTADGGEKKKKRGLFGFGKKKAEEAAKPASKSASTSQSAPTARRTTAASPIQTDRTRFSPSSPGRSGFASSPRLVSPAGSQIFERDVSAAVMPNSPAIPSHIQTEDYIPPVLDASSEAITDDHLNPDTVEIITHSSHQPASVTVTGLSPYEPSPHWADELAAFSAQRTATPTASAADNASNYGSFDTTDVRRLSFISFADVVQAEQAGPHGSRDSMYLAGLTSLAGGMASRRSPSPIRSPVSSAGGGGPGSASPPASKSGSVKGLEVGAGGSPRKPPPPLGSPTSMLSMLLGGGLGVPAGPTVSGEIAIETMTEALRRTGSGDLSSGGASVGGMRSFPASPI